MQTNRNAKTHHRLRFSLSNEVNGLVLVIGVLLALMLLPGPSEAEFKVRDIQMNNIVTVDDMKKPQARMR